MKLLIIIPAYNEQASIERVVGALIRDYPQYDYIVVNDGSSDDTAEICGKCGYRVLNLPINLGLSGAFQAGLRYADKNGYDYAIQYDADGQHLPEYIKPMLDAFSDNADIVIGSRFCEKNKPRNLRMVGSYLISWAITLASGARICDPTSGMRMYNKRMISEFANNLNYGPEPDTISYLIKHGAKVKEVQVAMQERIAGKSYFSLVVSIKYMVRMILSILLIQIFRSQKTFRKEV